MVAILNLTILNLAIFESAILVFLSNSLTLAKIGSHHLHKKKLHSLILTPTWWWQPTWILPCWIQTLPSWIKTSCYLLSDSLKNTLPPLWLWLKLINLAQTHSFSLNLMMAVILNSAILDSPILVFHLKLTDTCQDWFPPFAQKQLHSFILTQLDDASQLEFCHVGFRHLVFFWDSLKSTLSPFWLWLKLIQSDSNSFILTSLNDGSHLEFSHL